MAAFDLDYSLIGGHYRQKQKKYLEAAQKTAGSVGRGSMGRASPKPWAFRGAPTGTIRGKDPALRLAIPGGAEERMGGIVQEVGTVGPNKRTLLGPRISHIGTGAISQATLLGNLEAGRNVQTPLFKPKNIKSEARQTGRMTAFGPYRFV